MPYRRTSLSGPAKGPAGVNCVDVAGEAALGRLAAGDREHEHVRTGVGRDPGHLQCAQHAGDDELPPWPGA